jgi:hypothetical protein
MRRDWPFCKRYAFRQHVPPTYNRSHEERFCHRRGRSYHPQTPPQPDAKLAPAAARAFLQLDFEEPDRVRMHQLAKKNQDDELTPAEEIELQSYLKVGLFLDLIHARARRSLQASAPSD